MFQFKGQIFSCILLLQYPFDILSSLNKSGWRWIELFLKMGINETLQFFFHSCGKRRRLQDGIQLSTLNSCRLESKERRNGLVLAHNPVDDPLSRLVCECIPSHSSQLSRTASLTLQSCQICDIFLRAITPSLSLASAPLVRNKWSTLTSRQCFHPLTIQSIINTKHQEEDGDQTTMKKRHLSNNKVELRRNKRPKQSHEKLSDNDNDEMSTDWHWFWHWLRLQLQQNFNHFNTTFKRSHYQRQHSQTEQNNTHSDTITSNKPHQQIENKDREREKKKQGILLFVQHNTQYFQIQLSRAREFSPLSFLPTLTQPLLILLEETPM